MNPSFERLSFLIVDFFLNTPFTISIHGDYLILLIITACLVVLLCCLLCLRFLAYWHDFTACLILFPLLISVG